MAIWNNMIKFLHFELMPVKRDIVTPLFKTKGPTFRNNSSEIFSIFPKTNWGKKEKIVSIETHFHHHKILSLFY